MRLLLLLLLCLTLPASAGESAKACDITKLAPMISQAPLRYVRFTAIIENRGGGFVALVDEGGEWTRSLVQPGARATLIEWKNIVLGPGEYETVLVAGSCTARGRLQVAGGDGP